jgi:hypothetical protein
LLSIRDVGFLARLSALFARREAKSNAEVEVVLDEDDLFDEPKQSGRRLKIGGISTQAFEPSEELLNATRATTADDDDEPTRRVELKELRARLGGRR